MPFNIPDNQQDVIDRARTDVQNALPETNPFIKNSFLGALIVSIAGRIYDFYLQLKILIRELFVDTATGDFLARWGSYRDVNRNPATKAKGNVTFTGTAGSVIPVGTLLQSSVGNTYETTISQTIVLSTINILSLTRSGSTVTATTVDTHPFVSTQTVTISGATQTQYNGSYQITVTAANQFEYTIVGTPVTPATGTIIATANLASIEIESQEFGELQNAANGEQLSLVTPILGVDSKAIVQFGEVAGGTDLETDEDYRARVIEEYQNPIALFNKNAIRKQAKKVPGVTRVWIIGAGEDYGDPYNIITLTRTGSIAFATTIFPHGLIDAMTVEVQGASPAGYNGVHRVLVTDVDEFVYTVDSGLTTPASGVITALPTVTPGQVVIFFTRDNDLNIIPSPTEVDDVYDSILEILPATTSCRDVIVLAPIPITVDFTFTSLTPNTSTMKAEIKRNLEAFFREGTDVGRDLKAFQYNSVIFQTVDSETGDLVQDFTLSTPIGDVTISKDQIPVLGTVMFT